MQKKIIIVTPEGERRRERIRQQKVNSEVMARPPCTEGREIKTENSKQLYASLCQGGLSGSKKARGG